MLPRMKQGKAASPVFIERLSGFDLQSQQALPSGQHQHDAGHAGMIEA